MRSMVGGALLLCMSAIAALAADGKDIAANGTSGGALPCSSCHGEHGEGTPASGFPRLAGLNVQYIEHQLESFKNGTRKNDVMQPIVAALSDDERKTIANYYANMTAPKAEAEPVAPAAIAAGAKLAATGDWPNGMPGCGQCHGAAGLGVGATFPRLAGQSATYIENALQSWKAGDRKNDPMGLMASVASKLNDEQIRNVAAYYESLPVAAPARSPETKP